MGTWVAALETVTIPFPLHLPFARMRARLLVVFPHIPFPQRLFKWVELVLGTTKYTADVNTFYASLKGEGIWNDLRAKLDPKAKPGSYHFIVSIYGVG